MTIQQHQQLDNTTSNAVAGQRGADEWLDGFDFGVIGPDRPLGFQFDTLFCSVARTWTKLGFNIIPGTKEKQPCVKFTAWSGEDAASVPDELLADWAQEYEDATPLLLPDSGKFVKFAIIDADDPKMIPWIEQEFGKTPVVVSTGREGGGAHLYYAQPEGQPVAGRNKEVGPDDGVESWKFEINATTGKVVKADGWGKTKIDVKSRRNYVVAPGALHKSGRTYTASVDLSSIDILWLKSNLPVFDNTLYEQHSTRAKERRAEKQKEIDVVVRPVTTATVPMPDMSAAISTPAKLQSEEPFIAWCRDNPDEVNLEAWWGLANNIAAVYGEKGREQFHNISALSKTKYEKEDCERTWRKALASIVSGGKPTTYQTLVGHGFPADKVPSNAKAPAVFLRRGMRLAFLRHRSGLFKGLPLDDRIENTRALLTFCAATVAYNEMLKATEYTLDGKKLDANDAEAEIRELGRKFDFKPTLTVFDEHLRTIRRQNSFHPVKKWIESKPWDGVDRFPALLASLKLSKGMDASLASILLYRWCLSAAAAIDRLDGVKVEDVLVLVGRQGCFKTSWINSLAPIGIADGKSLDPSDKDSVLGCIRNWIVELGELDATFRKADLAKLKAFLSQTTDTIRVPYARREDSFPRRTVFAASVNNSDFLRDTTGNRRYWTIAVESCNAMHGIDVQQLWAQMLALVRKGERHWLVKAEEDLLNEQNIKHMEADPMEQELERHFTPAIGTWTSQTVIRDAVKDAFSGWGQREARAMTSVLRRWADKQGTEERRSNGERLWSVKPRGDATGMPEVSENALADIVDRLFR